VINNEHLIKQLRMFFQSHITLSGDLSYFFKVVRLIFSLQNYRTLIAGFHCHAIKKAQRVFQVTNPIYCCREERNTGQKDNRMEFYFPMQQQQQKQQQQ